MRRGKRIGYICTIQIHTVWMDDSDVAVLAFYNSIASISKNIPISNEFTVNELQKLGFRWSKIGIRYLGYMKKIK